MSNEIPKIYDILRNKYMKDGLSSLTEFEKFILILSYSESEHRIETVAKSLLKHYGKLGVAMDSDPQFLINDCGVNLQSALLITMIPRLKQICELEKCRLSPLDTVDKAKKYFSAFFRSEHIEIFVATAVSDDFRIIGSKILSSGEVSEVSLSCREIADFVVQNACVNLFISHNHPMGICLPSMEDIYSTITVKEALGLLGVTLIDHIVVGSGGDNDVFSMRLQLKKRIFDDVDGYGCSHKK